VLGNSHRFGKYAAVPTHRWRGSLVMSPPAQLEPASRTLAWSAAPAVAGEHLADGGGQAIAFCVGDHALGV